MQNLIYLVFDLTIESIMLATNTIISNKFNYFLAWYLALIVEKLQNISGLQKIKIFRAGLRAQKLS